GAHAAIEFYLRPGDEEVRQRVADRRAVGDVAGQRAGVLDLRRAEDVEDGEQLGDARLDERLERGEGDVRAGHDDAVLFAQLVESRDLGQRQHGRRGEVALVDPDADVGGALHDGA